MSTESSKLSKLLRAEKMRYRKKILDRLCTEISTAAKCSKNGKVPYGFVNKLLQQSKREEPWINRNAINFAYRKYCDNTTTNVNKWNTEVSITTTTTAITKTLGGRPKGTTTVKKSHLREVLFAAKNEIATLYLEEKKKYKNKGEKLPNNWLQNQIRTVCAKRGIPSSISISEATIRSRKGKNILQGGGPETLMALVEPHLIQLICAMAEIRRCLTVSEAIALGNSMIKGTETERKIIEWKKARNELNENSPVLGRK